MVTEGIRECVGRMVEDGRLGAEDAVELERECDRADARHDVRIERSRHETKRAFAKYVRRLTMDYERGVKWRRPR